MPIKAEKAGGEGICRTGSEEEPLFGVLFLKTLLLSQFLKSPEIRD